MKNLSKIIGIFLFAVFSVNIQAENIDECKSDLYFANGIMMKYSEGKALRMWKKEVKKLLTSKPEVYAKIANRKISYNISQGFLDDFLESYEQVMNSEWGWETFTAFFKIYLTDKGIQEDWVPHIKDLTQQVNSYKESIKLGHGIVVIAHSQGNYYTNEAYELLDDWMKSYFKMMGVASPANHVAGFGVGDTTAPYVKFHNDFIKLVVTGLSSNKDDPNPNHNGTFSVAAHDFYESYLTAKNTKGEILEFIETKVKEHSTAPSQWETNEESELNTCNYKITVKHRYDPDNIIMDDIVYPFAPNKKLYQVNGEWVKASCDGSNILETWKEKKDNECFMIDNLEEERIFTQEQFIRFFVIFFINYNLTGYYPFSNSVHSFGINDEITIDEVNNQYSTGVIECSGSSESGKQGIWGTYPFNDLEVLINISTQQFTDALVGDYIQIRSDAVGNIFTTTECLLNKVNKTLENLTQLETVGYSGIYDFYYGTDTLWHKRIFGEFKLYYK